MTVLSSDPDLSLELRAERYAPRLARQAIRQVDGPSPDLRDAVTLLVSNLVTRACRLEDADQDPPNTMELRAWMPPDIVRVEVCSDRDILEAPPAGVAPQVPDCDVELLTNLADRWGVEHPARQTLVWFEIDRVAGARGR